MISSETMRAFAVALALIPTGCRSCDGQGGGGVDATPPARPTLTLVSARDRLEGAFTTPRSVYADATRIYLASRWRPELFVLARDRGAGFPVIDVVALGCEPYSVGGDGTRVYVACGDGAVHVYEGSARVAMWPVAALGLSDLEPHGGSLFVGVGQTDVAVDAHRVFVSALNPDNPAHELSLAGGSCARTFGAAFEENATVAFDRATAARRGAIANPLDLLGRPSAVNLYADGDSLYVTIPGCCGPAIHVHDAATLAQRQVIARTHVNVVVRRGRWLIAGNEGGQVDVFDLAENPSPLVASVDLRAVTGHTGLEDIEIRSLWIDAIDSSIFAGSSWGNDESRGPELPSFFVLDLVE